MITLSGQLYRAVSPSYIEHVGTPLAIAFDGRSGLISIRGIYGTREFKTRDEAAQLIGHAFNQAEIGNSA